MRHADTFRPGITVAIPQNERSSRNNTKDICIIYIRDAHFIAVHCHKMPYSVLLLWIAVLPFEELCTVRSSGCWDIPEL